MKKEITIFQNIGLIFQTIVSMFLICSLFITKAEKELTSFTILLLILTFVGLAYNNLVTFKRKGFTILYLIVAIAALVGLYL